MYWPFVAAEPLAPLGGQQPGDGGDAQREGDQAIAPCVRPAAHQLRASAAKAKWRA